MQTSLTTSRFEDPDGFFDSPDVVVSPSDAPGPGILDQPNDEANQILEDLGLSSTPDADISTDASAGKDVLDALDQDLNGDEDPITDDGNTNATAGRRKVDKSAMVEAATKLIEKGVLFAFEDEKDADGKVTKKAKTLEEYTTSDFIELFETNLKEKEEELEDKARKDLFSALPTDMQYALKYFMNGGQDAAGLFKALGAAEETRVLDVTNVDDQKVIVRQYLSETNFGTKDEIEEQLNDYISAGVLGKWAEKHKPKLDEIEDKRIQKKLVDQEEIKKANLKRQQDYLGNVRAALKDSQLGETKIDVKRRDQLWGDLTQTNYELSNGRKTNKLGHLLEQVQFGEKPDYDLLAQVTWLLDDPKSFHEHFAKSASSAVAVETARKLKSAEANKNAAGAGTAANEGEETTSKRTIKRRINILTGRPD